MKSVVRAALVTATLLTAMLVSTGPASAAPAASPAFAGRPAPACRCVPVTSYPPPAATDGPFGITQGPGGTWYAEGGQIVRVGHGGTIQEFALPDPATADAGWLTWAGGHTVWFADRGNDRLGEISASGTVAEYQLPAVAGPGAGPGVGPGGIVVQGSTVWFTDPANNRIGRFNTHSHRFTMYAVPTASAWPLGLTIGPDHALWFVERSAGKLARMTATGAFREWALAPDSFPNRIIVGPDRQLWFTELDAGLIGRMSMGGVLTQTPVVGGPVGITMGPDGRVYAALWNSHQLARLDSSGHVTATWSVPGALLVASSRGALWLTDPFANTVARVQVNCRPSQPARSG